MHVSKDKMMSALSAGCLELHHSLGRVSDALAKEGVSQLWEIWTPWKYCLSDSEVKLSNKREWDCEVMRSFPALVQGSLPVKAPLKTHLNSVSWPRPRCHYGWQTDLCLLIWFHSKRSVKQQEMGCGVKGFITGSRVWGNCKQKEEWLWMIPKYWQCCVCVP